jgi:hypothetical protein
MFKVSWQSVVMAALAGAPVAMTTYNIGLMQGNQSRPVAAPVAAPAPVASTLYAPAQVPVASDAFADAPTAQASPEVAQAEPIAAAPRAAAAPTTAPASDRPQEFLVPLAIKPTGKSRPSTVGRAAEPPKNAIVAEAPAYRPRNPYGQGTVYAPGSHPPVDYGYGPEYNAGYGYGYPYGAYGPSYYRPAVREQEPLLPFDRGGSYRSSDRGYTVGGSRFTPR